VSTDGGGHLDERGQAAALRPGDPLIEHRESGRGGKLEDLPELFLEQLGLVERPVGRLDGAEAQPLTVSFSGSSTAPSARP
jgi:hypothetical protein